MMGRKDMDRGSRVRDAGRVLRGLGDNFLDFLCVLKKNSGKYLQVKKIVCTFALHFG